MKAITLAVPKTAAEAGLTAWYGHDEMFYSDSVRMAAVWRAMEEAKAKLSVRDQS
jgi:hypothetical protein